MLDSADVSPLINIEESKSGAREPSDDEVISALSPAFRKSRKSLRKQKRIVISKNSEETDDEEGELEQHEEEKPPSPVIPKSRTRKMKKEGQPLTRLTHMAPGLPMKIPSHKKVF